MLSESLDNRKKCNHLYHCFVFGKYGMLGRCNRICIPVCVVSFIREICPDPHNNYTWHHDFNEDVMKMVKQSTKMNLLNLFWFMAALTLMEEKKSRCLFPLKMTSLISQKLGTSLLSHQFKGGK